MNGWMRAAVLLAAGMLCACGGGGGEGGGSSGPPEFAISPDSVSFTAAQNGTPPPPRTVIVSAVSGTTFVDVTQPVGLPFSANFVLTSTTQGTITITPHSSFTAGVFTGAITVRGCSVAACVSGDVPGSPKTIAVTYTVVPASTVAVTPTFLNFATAQGASPASRNLALATTTGATAWTSQIQYATGSGWLDLPAAGTFPDNVTVSVDSAALAPGNYSATVTFTSGIVSTSIPVALMVSVAGVNFVAPYVATINVAGSVIIRGYGLAGATAVRFGAIPATSFSVVSDTETRADHPAMSAGSHAVEVDVGSGPLATRANLVVVDVPGHTAAVVARPAISTVPAGLIYDAERAAVYLLDNGANRIDRYRFTAGGWNADSLPFAGPVGNWSIALSPDGTELLKTGLGAITRVNPASLGVISAVPTTSVLGGDSIGPIAFANDGRAIGTLFAAPTNIYSYDVLAQLLTPLSSDPKSGQRDVAASGDGDKLVLAFRPTDLAGVPILTYDSGTGALAPSTTLTTESNHVTLGRTGARAAIRTNSIPGITQIYDDSLVLLGTLPSSIGRVVFSPDERYAYGFDIGARTIRKFDLDAPGGFTEIGSGTAPHASPTLGLAVPQLAISPDGGTLFLAGDQNFVVMPAP